MITFRLYVQLFLNLIENDAEINLVVVLVDAVPLVRSVQMHYSTTACTKRTPKLLIKL